MNAFIEQFEAERESDFGKRFSDSIEKAGVFMKKHDKSGGLSLKQIRFFALMIKAGDICDVIAKVYDFAYRRGYQAAKKAERG